MINLVLSNITQFIRANIKFFHGRFFNTSILGTIIWNGPNIRHFLRTFKQATKCCLCLVHLVPRICYSIHRRIWIGMDTFANIGLRHIKRCSQIVFLNHDESVYLSLVSALKRIHVVILNFMFRSALWRRHYKII